MDSNCNTECDKLDETPYGVRPLSSRIDGDLCPRELKPILSTQYPATPNAISSTSAAMRSGGPLSRIETPHIQTVSDMLHPIVLIGDKKKLGKLIPKIDGRVIVKKTITGEEPVFQIVSGSLKNLVQLDTALSADFVLGGNKRKNICSPDPCACAQRMQLVKIPIVGAPPPAITAVDDTAEAEYMTPVNIAVLTNDSGDTIAVISAGPTEFGVVEVELDGTITFTPAEGVTGDVSFTYTIQDSHGQTDTATVTVTVGAAPEILAVDDDIEVDYEAGAYNFDATSNDTGVGLEVISVTAPLYGTATIELDGTITYTPPVSLFRRDDQFTYTVEDDYGQTSVATVNVSLVWDDYIYLDTAVPAFTTVTGVVGTWRAVATYNTPSGDVDEFFFDIASTALYDISLQPFKFPKVSGTTSSVTISIYRPNGTLAYSNNYTATAPKADGVLVGIPQSIEVIATLD